MIRSFRRLAVGLLFLAAPALAAPTDSVPPADITSLTALAGSTGGTVTLQWTASGDNGLVGTALRYYVRYSSFSLAGVGTSTATWWNGSASSPTYTYKQSWTPAAPGAGDSQMIVGLTEGATFYFGIVAEDACNNRSSLIFSTGTNQATASRIFPAVPVSTPMAGDRLGRMNLSFNHVGDDAGNGLATTYTVYRSTFAGAVTGSTVPVLNGTLFVNIFTVATDTTNAILIPKAAGTAESLLFTNLPVGTTQYFRLEARDEVPNGVISAEVSGLPQTADMIAPSPVTSLSVDLSTPTPDGAVALQWVYAPDQDNSVPARYVIYYSSTVQMRALSNDHLKAGVTSQVVNSVYSIISSTSLQNSTQTAIVPGLVRRQSYYFTAVSSDAAGLFSPVFTVLSAVAVDSAAPSAVTGITALVFGPDGGRVQVSWTAPGDDGGAGAAVARYQIKYATYAAANPASWWTGGEGATPWLYDRSSPAPQAKGTVETQVISGLAGPATAYWFAVVSYDVNGSSISVSTTSASSAVGSDILPPAAITLSVLRDAVVRTTANLTWTAPADPNSGVTGYTVRWSTGSPALFLNATDWWYGLNTTSPTAVGIVVSTATPGGTPKDPGQSESYALTGVSTAAVYVMIRAKDAVGNVSDLSNSSAAVTVASVSVDVSSPATVTDVTVSSVSVVAVTTLYNINGLSPTTGQVEVTWTAPADDGPTGSAMAVATMHLRYAGTAIGTSADWDAATPSTVVARPAPSVLASGSKQSYVVTGLAVGTTYYFAVRGQDAAGNLGAISSGNLTWSPPSQVVPIEYFLTLSTTGISTRAGEYYHLGPLTIVGSTTTSSGMAMDPVTGRGIQLNKNGTGWMLGGTASSTLGKGLVWVSGRVGHGNGTQSLEDIRQSDVGTTTVNLPALAWTPTVSQMQAGTINTNDTTNPEFYESRLVALRGVQKVDAVTNIWPAGTSTSAINYLVYDDTGGPNVQTTVRFSVGTNMSGFVEPGVGKRFDVIGALSQFDTSDPRFSGYQVFPASNTTNTKALGIIERPRGLSALAGGNQQVTLMWAGVTDPDRNGFKIYSTTVSPVNPNPNWTMALDTTSAGLSQITVTSGLTIGATHYFYVAMKQNTNTTWSAVGSAGNAFQESGPPFANGLTIGEVAWAGVGVSADVTAPAGITNLTAAPATSVEGGVALTWTAPGDDGAVGTATKYVVRYATWPTGGPSDVTAWFDGQTAPAANVAPVQPYLNVPAPRVAGSSETLTLSGLAVGATYYIAIRAVDEAGNVSTNSALVNAYASNLTPNAPTGVSLSVAAGSIVLSWLESATSGQFGETVGLTDISSGSYRIYWNDGRSGMRDTVGSANGSGCYDNVVLAPQTAAGVSVDGLKRVYIVGGLANGRNYYFAISAVDSAGRESTPSNEIIGVPAASPPVRFTEISFFGPGDANLASGSTGKDQFIELYNASDAPVDIGKWFVTTRSLGGTLANNFVKAWIPAGAVLGPRSYYVIGFVENTGLYRAGTRSGVIYPLADYDQGDPETLDVANEKPSSLWPSGQGPGRSAFGISKGSAFSLLLPSAEPSFDKSLSGSWKIGAKAMAGKPVVDRITIRATGGVASNYVAESDGSPTGPNGNWPDTGTNYVDTASSAPFGVPAGIGPDLATRVSSQTLTFQRKDDDVDNDRLDDWKVERANPGLKADTIAPSRVAGLTVSGLDMTEPILDNVEGGLKLTFGAVGDDGLLPGSLGRANGYVVNYATWMPSSPADLAAWIVNMSTYVDLTPRTIFAGGTNIQTVSWVPLAPSSLEKHRLGAVAFKVGTRYTFAIRAFDDAGNDSGIGLDSFLPQNNPNPVGFLAVNPFAGTDVKPLRVTHVNFGKSSLFTRPDKTTKMLVKTPGYLADTGNPDSGNAVTRVDKVTILAGTLDPETLPTATATLKKGGTTLSTVALVVNTDGSLPEIVIGDRSTTKVGEEANLADQVDITFPALPGLTLTRYNDVYPPSKPGEVENTVKPVVDSAAGTISAGKGAVEPFGTIIFYGQNPAGKTRAELPALEIKAAPGRAGGAPYAAFASTAADTNGGFPATSVGTGNSYVYVVVKDAAGNLSPAFAVLLPPTVTELDAIGPNPLLPSKTKAATLWFNLKEVTKVKAVVFNANGELVKTLLDDEEFDAGWGRTRVNGQPDPGEMVKNGEQPAAGTVVRTIRAVAWDGMNEAGKRVASGVYLVRFEAGGVKTTKKMLVIQ